MKILLIADFDIQSGTGTYFKRIVPYLAQKGDLHVVLSKQQTDVKTLEFLSANNVSFSKDLIKFQKLERIIMRITRKIKFLHWYQYFRDYIIMRRLSMIYKPDLFFISQGGGDRYFAFLKAKCRVYIVCHSLWMEDYNKKIFGNAFKHFISENINISNKKIITVSNYAKMLFTKDLPKVFDSITSVIPNYADVNHPYNNNIDEIHTSEKNQIILTLGHMTGWKNPAVWIKTASLVHQKHGHHVKFIWAGKPMEWEKYKEDFAKEENVDFLGFIENTNQLYNDATLYFQPSIQESQGIAVIEALSYGIPCIVSNAGGLPESITDGIEGFVRDPWSADEFAKCIIKLLSDNELLKRMSLSAKNKYKSCFTKKMWQLKMDVLF